MLFAVSFSTKRGRPELGTGACLVPYSLCVPYYLAKRVVQRSRFLALFQRFGYCAEARCRCCAPVAVAAWSLRERDRRFETSLGSVMRTCFEEEEGRKSEREGEKGGREEGGGEDKMSTLSNERELACLRHASVDGAVQGCQAPTQSPLEAAGG